MNRHIFIDQQNTFDLAYPALAELNISNMDKALKRVILFWPDYSKEVVKL